MCIPGVSCVSCVPYKSIASDGLYIEALVSQKAHYGEVA